MPRPPGRQVTPGEPEGPESDGVGQARIWDKKLPGGARSSFEPAGGRLIRRAATSMKKTQSQAQRGDERNLRAEPQGAWDRGEGRQQGRQGAREGGPGGAQRALGGGRGRPARRQVLVQGQRAARGAGQKVAPH